MFLDMTLKDRLILYTLLIASFVVIMWVGYLLYQFSVSLKKLRSRQFDIRLNSIKYGNRKAFSKDSSVLDLDSETNLEYDRNANQEWEEHFRSPTLEDHLSGYDKEPEK